MTDDTKGNQMTSDALTGPEPEVAQAVAKGSTFDSLTGRERQVAAALATGSTNREIADKLDISIKTVDTHRAHVLKKLCVRNNVQLARKAARDGFVSLDETS